MNGKNKLRVCHIPPTQLILRLFIDDRSSIHNLFLNSNSGDRDTQADPSTGLTLEDKIQKAFELPRLEKRHHGKKKYNPLTRGSLFLIFLIIEYACWLVKNVLLRGYLLVTDGHLCFWANIPSDEVNDTLCGNLLKSLELRGMIHPLI